MDKLILLSVIAAHVLIPIAYASDDNPRRGLSKMIIALFLFNVCYVGALYFIYPRLNVLQ